MLALTQGENFGQSEKENIPSPQGDILQAATMLHNNLSNHSNNNGNSSVLNNTTNENNTQVVLKNGSVVVPYNMSWMSRKIGHDLSFAIKTAKKKLKKEDSDVVQWDSVMVAEWLTDNNWPQYAKLFKKEKIDG